MTPSIISKGNKILKLDIEEWNIAFLDSYKYIKASLAKCCKMYQIDMKKGFFPHLANREHYYNSGNMSIKFLCQLTTLIFQNKTFQYPFRP